MRHGTQEHWPRVSRTCLITREGAVGQRNETRKFDEAPTNDKRGKESPPREDSTDEKTASHGAQETCDKRTVKEHRDEGTRTRR